MAVLLWTLLIACAWGQESSPADALVGAILQRDPVRVKALLEQGVSPNAPDQHGNMPLIAALQGHASERAIIRVLPSIVQLLLDHGAQIDDRALTTLADQYSEEREIMLLLLGHGARATAAALQLAARRGHAGEVKLLLGRGANGQTALLEAATSERDQQSEVLKLLLAGGVKDEGHAAARAAAMAGFPDRVVLLRGSEDARTLALDRGLIRVILLGDPKAVADFLGRRANPNARSEDGSPVLVLAAGKSFAAESVKLLLNRGAQVDATDSEGQTALMLAARQFAMDVVKTLLDKGASLSAVDRKGNTVLLAATCASAFPDGRAKLVELLLARGADAKATDLDGVNAAMLAARCGNLALPALVEKGADVNASDKDGRTALMIAATKGDEEVVRFLLDKGADVRARDKTGRSVLLTSIDAPPHFSYDNQTRYSYPIASLLVMRGSDVNAASDNGDTPLEVAVRRGYDDIRRLLVEHGARVR